MGTPKTLREAIRNGLKGEDQLDCIEKHVRDYLAQKFGTELLKALENVKEIEELWRSL